MEIFIYLCVLAVIVVSLFLITKLNKSKPEEEIEDNVVRQQPNPTPHERGARRRNVRQRLADTRRNLNDSDEEQENEELDVILPDGKVGAKKLKKLQEKAERRQQREAEEREREDRKKRDRQKDEEIKKQDAKEAANEALQKEEVQKLKEEEEKREYEEYLKLKESFIIEEEGTHEEDINQDNTSLLQEFINYIKNMKVLMIEDLAAHFKIRTQDAVDRIKVLLEEERLSGVLDDRGKFIYISQDEYLAVAKFIKQRGRVSIAELAECSLSLINLSPDNESMLKHMSNIPT